MDRRIGRRLPRACVRISRSLPDALFFRAQTDDDGRRAHGLSDFAGQRGSGDRPRSLHARPVGGRAGARSRRASSATRSLPSLKIRPAQGMRTLAFAYRRLPADCPRHEDAIHECREEIENGPGLRRLRRHPRSAPARSERGDAGVPGRRHRGHDDHRRQHRDGPLDRQGDRPAR